MHYTRYLDDKLRMRNVCYSVVLCLLEVVDLRHTYGVGEMTMP
jgi:hypothetical protein